MKALITDTEIENPDIERQILERAGFQVEIAQARKPAEVIAAARDADALLVQYATISADVFEALPNVRMVSRLGTGVDSVDLKAAEKHGVWVSNVPVYGYDEVPTHALSLMFSLLRHVTFHDRNVRKGIWRFQETGPVDSISELTLGIVGLGRLGQLVADRAHKFFHEIVAYDPMLPADRWPAYVKSVSLEELFAQSHAITMHMPLTDETKNVVNKSLLGKIPPRGAYLVNTARGGLIDLDDALWALDKGLLRGVGLDVMPVEPPPMDHPILQHARAIVTPHSAWYSTASARDLRRKYAENVAIWGTEGKAPNAVVKGAER